MTVIIEPLTSCIHGTAMLSYYSLFHHYPEEQAEVRWCAPYLVAWLNSTQTPESGSPRTDDAAPSQ
jgi:hypothetical protein